MEQSNFKNMVILKDIPSNIIEEAIIILKENKKAKRLEKIETKEGIKKKERTNDYILKEAEIFVNNYISKIEQKKKTMKWIRCWVIGVFISPWMHPCVKRLFLTYSLQRN